MVAGVQAKLRPEHQRKYPDISASVWYDVAPIFPGVTQPIAAGRPGTLRAMGYTNVSVYVGGKQDWTEAGLALEVKEVQAA